MALNLTTTVIQCLADNPDHKYTAREIAQWINDTYPAECQDKKARSRVVRTDDELIQQLAAEIGSRRPQLHKKCPQLRTTEGRPRKYYYTEQSESEEVQAIESSHQQTDGGTPGTKKASEHDLYPVLSEYLKTEYTLYSKRIDEKRSSNRRGPNGNKWLYPDVVGMEDLGTEWHQDIKDCVGQYADKRTKLWSFEVKLLLNSSNVRKLFFQAVSNSSWANLGYFVAAEITDMALKELRILSSAHGIGVIRLEVGNPAESQILIPATERLAIDWDTANRLANENSDYRAFITQVRQFYQTGDPRFGDWDTLLDTAD